MLRMIQIILIMVFIGSVALFVLALWEKNRDDDREGPVITMESPRIQMSVKDDVSHILNGVTAADQKDGDVSDTLVVESLSNFIEKGRRQATIAAFDENNHVTKVKREVIYTDYHSPHFSLESPLRFNLNSRESILENVTAYDVLDGDISNRMTVRQENVDGVYSSLEPGYYHYLISAVNSAGDLAQLPVTVELYTTLSDNQCPKVILSDYLIYIQKGTQIDPASYIESVMLDHQSWSMDTLSDETPYTKNDIQIQNPVDPTTPGTYEIVYTMENSKLEQQSQIRLIVIVEE